MANRSFLPSIWNQGRDVNRLQHRINQIFDDFFTEPFSRSLSPSQDFKELEREFSPPCDVSETDSHYLFGFDLPGVKKDEVKIEVRENQLIVSGERKREQKEDVKGHLNQESFYGSFVRVFNLPSNVDASQAEASFENGVLQISLPKTENSQRKQIPIKEGKSLSQKKEKAA